MGATDGGARHEFVLPGPAPSLFVSVPFLYRLTLLQSSWESLVRAPASRWLAGAPALSLLSLTLLPEQKVTEACLHRPFETISPGVWTCRLHTHTNACGCAIAGTHGQPKDLENEGPPTSATAAAKPNARL